MTSSQFIALASGITLLIVALVHGVKAQTVQTPAEQALAERIMAEMNSSLQCSTALIEAKRKITELERQLGEAKQPKASK